MSDKQQTISNQLPADVKFILDSDVGYLQELQLSQKYNLFDDLGTISDLVEKIYAQQIKLNDLADYVKTNLPDLNPADTNKFLSDLIGWRVLPIKDYLAAQNVPGVLSVLGGRESDYAVEVEKTKKAVAEEAAGTFDALDYREDVDDRKFKPELEPAEIEENLGDDELNDKDKKSNLLTVFNSNLSDILNIDAVDEMYQFLNDVAVDCLAADPAFGAKAAAALAANQAVIIKQNLVLNNKTVPGTAANWLQDFFRINGSSRFDALALSTYLSDSSNVKRLTPVDKNILNRFFKLYRNLQFFPQGFDQSNPNQWQILPEAELNEAVPAAVWVSTQAEENLAHSPAVNELEQLAAQYASGSLERMAIEEELQRQAENHEAPTDDLASLAEQYPAGSLEREAIEEEIRKQA